MTILIRILILAISVWVAAYIIPGVKIDNFQALLVVALVLGAINAFIKPILVILTLPLTIVTLGLFILVINGALVFLVDAIVPGFSVGSFLAAVLFSLVVSLISSLLSKLA